MRVLALLLVLVHAACAGAPAGVGGDTIEFEVGSTEPVLAARAGVSAPAPLFTEPSDASLARWRRIELAGVAAADRAHVADEVLAELSRAGIATAYRTPVLSPAVIEPVVRPDATARQDATVRCDVTPALAPPSDDACPIRTPLFDAAQAYLSAAPKGIDVGAAWELPGGRGQGVWFADIEGGWNTRHEDIPGGRIEHVAGEIIDDRGWEAHGTAVVGVAASRDNRLGMIGIAPAVDRIFTGSIGGMDVASAIDLTAKRMRPGDVLLIELHGPGPRSRPGGGQQGFVPVEWWQAAFDVIRVHTQRGLVIVEAAGNGAEDLDHPIYLRKFDPAVRHSGAIMVGAGAPDGDGYVDRSRLDFSNYGKRVDLQGLGRKVATLDYGDLQGCAETSRKYTAHFAGTSSASPIVAGAVISIQGIYRARTGLWLPPQKIRDLLVRTGSPQVNGPHGPATQHIGPRPDLRRAIRQLH